MSRVAETAQPTQVERLSPAEKAGLVVEVLFAYARARRALSRFAFPTAVATLRDGVTGVNNVEFSAADHLVGKQLGGAVRGTLRPIPKRSKCLLQSLTLTTMLARRGIDSSIVIGVQSGEAFGAHAWVEYHGRPLLPTSKRRFERLTEV